MSYLPLRLRTRAAIVTLALVLLAGLVAHAMASPAALTTAEAAKVVDLVEKLSPELGPLAYDEETADEWFTRDEVRGGLIAKAGFTRESWRAAFDATFCGYLANLPEAPLDARFAQMRKRLEHTPRMTPEQRAAALAFVDEHEQRLGQLRAAGRPDAATVRPLVSRLDRLMPQDVASE
ncbi:hypothetical protein KHC28_07750 [Ancylobacter sonchi]|uniref:hypothetical protein n=1 Tax=Ancylobacter sonchi TaxID=1937790 RepID=UPI001BD2724D|nr:hypothetical protein [Ancylobacter sonchi]MBS7533548.1 hypothetical protein [Ancylobacter sonchi]